MRLNTWEQELRAFIEERRKMPYEIGRNDCCLFVADAVLAMTGKDPAKDYRGYSTQDEAQAILDVHGGIEALATAAFGESRGVLCAMRGDVVSVDTPEGLALGICTGRVAAFVTDGGLRFRPLIDCKQSWRV